MKNILKNLKVKQKLFLSFGISILFMLVIAGIGLLNTSNIFSNAKSISQEHMPSIDLLLQIDRDMQQTVVAQRTMIFSNVNSDLYKTLLKDNDENIDQSKERWENYKKLGHDGVSDELIKKYEDAREEWLKYSKRIVEARSKDTPEGRIEAIDLSFKEGNNSFEAAREIINKLTEITENIASKDVTSSESDYSNSLVVIVIGLLFIIILSILIAKYVAKSIGEPIIKASNMMQELQKGKLNTRINLNTEDEIGILSRSMDSFADTLKGFAQSMYAVADGNLNVEINLLDSEDQISPALQKTVKSLQDLKS